MARRFLEPSTSSIRKPTDNNQVNKKIINPPRYAEHGGLSSAGKVVGKGNDLNIVKPGN